MTHPLLNALDADIPELQLTSSLRLIEPVGEGGSGSVYRAYDATLDQDVAVKVLRAGGRTGAALQRFDREAKVLARISHPGIARILRADIDHETPHIVMHWEEGETLEHWQPGQENILVAALKELAAALGYLHTSGLVHGDIKPANVIRRDDERLVVVDFGLSGTLNETSTGGTVGYVAPEILGGSVATTASDVFAFGALCRELLKRVSSVRSASAWNSFVERATDAEPARRFADANAMHKELDKLARLAADRFSALPPDEQTWMRVVATMLSAAAGSVAWTLLLSLSPRWVTRADMHRLGVMAPELVHESTYLSWTRLEVDVALVAVAVTSVALFAYGLLRRHWRLERIVVDAPDAPIEWRGRVLLLAGASLVLYFARLVAEAAFDARWPMQMMPFVGGLLMLALTYWGWMCFLEAKRRCRPLLREKVILFSIVAAGAIPFLALERFISQLAGQMP